MGTMTAINIKGCIFSFMRLLLTNILLILSLLVLAAVVPCSSATTSRSTRSSIRSTSSVGVDTASLLLMQPLITEAGASAGAGASNEFTKPVITGLQKNAHGEPNLVLQLIHKSTNSEKDHASSLLQLIQQDESRVSWIQSKTTTASTVSTTTTTTTTEDDTISSTLLQRPKTTTSYVQVPAHPGYNLSTANYVVNIELGTPRQSFTLVLDTGSDATWVQSRPCQVSCYVQQGPPFDPSASSTFSNVSCSTAAQCTSLLKPAGGASNCSLISHRCLYGFGYGDGSFSIGALGHDTLTLAGTDTFPKFLFGCGQYNKGLFGQTNGLLGLGRDKLSIVSQTAAKYKAVFSYCLPLSAASQSGFLAFGAAHTTNSSSGYVFTPMLKGPSQSMRGGGGGFYFLSLTGISVAGRMISVSPLVFSKAGSTIIDSGTVITRLSPTVYDALKSAFREEMGKNSYPLAAGLSILDTCYDLSNHTEVQIPTVALHFQKGAELRLDARNTLLIASVQQVCLAFAPSLNSSTAAGGGRGPLQQPVTIIGNRQQLGTEVVYDIPKARIGFRTGAC